MATIDRTFHRLFDRIFTDGVEYENKNRGVKRLQIPSFTLRHKFEDGFPAITNKDLYWKGIVGELIWFLRGDNNVKYLNDNGIRIWNKDAYNWYVQYLTEGNKLLRFKLKEKIFSFKEIEEQNFDVPFFGSVGQNYSVQWRAFNGEVDQIKDLVDGMKKDIMSSRLKVNAWNPSEIFETALPPCHSEFQVIGVPLAHGSFGFELHWNQRSVDTFLGLPFNVASYGLLAKIFEALTGYKAIGIEGTLKCVHFYDNQYEAAREFLKRDPDKHPNCDIQIDGVIGKPNKDVDIDEQFNIWKIDDFKLIGYTADPALKVEMLAPKKL